MKNFGFLTRATFSRICTAASKVSSEVPVSEIFQNIYSHDLSMIINHKEAKKLYAQKLALENNPEQKKNLLKLKEKIKSEMEKESRQQYIFKVSPSKYHLDPSCKYLFNEFNNYYIPAEVRERGDDAINEFKNYCEINKNELLQNEAAFWAKAAAKYNFHSPSIHVNAKNSGIQKIVMMSKEELIETINLESRSCLDILEKNIKITELKNHQYADPESKSLASIKNSENFNLIEDYLDSKRKIITALFYLFMKNSQSETFSFDINFLESVGINNCKGCGINYANK